MTWVRRQADQPQPHRCHPPMREVEYNFPSGSLTPPTEPPKPIRMTVVDGQDGDLWRCDECRELWRIATACDGCDRGVWHQMCSTGQTWRPARLGQILRAWLGRR